MTLVITSALFWFRAKCRRLWPCLLLSFPFWMQTDAETLWIDVQLEAERVVCGNEVVLVIEARYAAPDTLHATNNPVWRNFQGDLTETSAVQNNCTQYILFADAAQASEQPPTQNHKEIRCQNACTLVGIAALSLIP